jgi:thiol-disulfide isomerase/thioredoxin
MALSLGLLLVAQSGNAKDLLRRGAPSFSRTDVNGARVSLASHHGKVVLLNFWATWCAPCRIEIPVFVEWQKKYGPQGFAVLGVSIDDDQAPVRALARELRVTYPIMMGDARLAEEYGGVLGVPVTFLIDRQGIIRARIDGESDLHTMETQIRLLLEAPQH